MLDLEQIRSFYPDTMQPFGRTLLREYLQYRILSGIAELPVAECLRFMGGTCIHMVHGSPRFSEDLNFDNLHISRAEFESLGRDVRRNLEADGYRVEHKMSFDGAFCAGFRFSGLLREQGMSGHAEEKLLIKVDSEPQDFAYVPAKVILQRFDVLLRLNVVPADILLAQKIHCVLSRKRAMGRDFFDVVHLIGKTAPNMGYLRVKTGIETEGELRKRMLSRWRELDTADLIRDVSPFLHGPRDVKRVSLFAEVIENWHPA